MNASEAMATLYEAVHPFGTSYTAGDAFTPKDIAKAQAAVYEVGRAIRLGDVQVSVECSTGGAETPLTVTTVLYRVACRFGKGPLPGDAITDKQIAVAEEAVEFAKRAFKGGQLKVRTAARA